MDTITVAMVDDHKIVRDGLRAMFLSYEKIDLVFEADNANDFMKQLASNPVKLAIVDLNLPCVSGEELIAMIKPKYPEVEILVLSGNVDEKSIISSVNAGARGYVSKDAGEDELIEAIYTTASGEEFYGGKISKILFRSYLQITNHRSIEKNESALTGREKEVIKYFAEGKSYKDISEILFISPRTVETHRNHIMEKLGLANLPDLVKYAIKNNIIEL